MAVNLMSMNALGSGRVKLENGATALFEQAEVARREEARDGF